MEKLPLVVLVGPTGIGKTTLAIQIAEWLKTTKGNFCEVVSTDSRQIYKKMDIGTAKPTAAELRAVPHRLVDLVEPDYVLTVAEFQDRAYQAIDQIHKSGKLPLLVGGTGQWVAAVVEGWGIPRVAPDASLRAELETAAAAVGAEAFHARLGAVDAEAAARIDYRNVRRVVRALEVYYKTGIPISEHQRKSPPPYSIIQFGLTMPRDDLYLRIDKRIDQMMDEGLLDEVQELHRLGYAWRLPAMSGLGYRQFAPYFAEDITLDEVVAQIKKDTRRFIRQQYNWFRPDDERIFWVDVTEDNFQIKIFEQIAAFIGEQQNYSTEK